MHDSGLRSHLIDLFHAVEAAIVHPLSRKATLAVTRWYQLLASVYIHLG